MDISTKKGNNEEQNKKRKVVRKITKRKPTIRSKFITYQQSYYGSGKTSLHRIGGIPIGATCVLPSQCGGSDSDDEYSFDTSSSNIYSLDVYKSYETELEIKSRKRRGRSPPIEWQQEGTEIIAKVYNNKKSDKPFLLGKGSFGEVYKGTIDDMETLYPMLKEKKVAIKVINCTSMGESDLVLKEITVMYKSYHKNILRILGARIKPPIYCIVSELAEKGSLSDILHPSLSSSPSITNHSISNVSTIEECSTTINSVSSSSSLPPIILDMKTRVNIALGISQGMDYLSNRIELIHRDLKPSNILLTNNYTPKICDFGESIFSPRSTTLDPCPYPRGTPVYMAPEVFRGERYGHKADVYSFGITLHELFSGEEPFNKDITKDNGWEDVVNRVAFEGYRPRKLDVKEAPLEIQQLIENCLLEDANKRPSWSDIVSILKNISSKL